MNRMTTLVIEHTEDQALANSLPGALHVDSFTGLKQALASPSLFDTCLISRRVGERAQRNFQEILVAEKFRGTVFLLGEIQNSFDNQEIVSVAESSRKLFALASRVATTDVSVLVTGESGTGKEIVAQYIHQQSRRAQAPFFAINCAAIPDNMLEAILFGYQKGAFTGAYKTTPGKFELANGGSLLLDEVTEMPPGLQAKLLRVLQEGEVERLGQSQPQKVDVRVIATTNRDVKAAVADGTLREDLYYRLNVFPLRISALRDRKEDILPLAMRFVEKHALRICGESVTLDPQAAQALVTYDWPGNVRQLENAVQRALVVQEGGQIIECDFELPNAAVTTENENCSTAALKGNLQLKEQQLIHSALRDTNGNRKQASQTLGISERTLRHKLQKMREAQTEVNAI